MNDFLLINNEAAEIIEKKIKKKYINKENISEKWDNMSKDFNMRKDAVTEIKNIKDMLTEMSNNADIRTVRQLIPFGERYGKIRFFLRRIIRKLIKWYIEPIVSDQNKYNNETLAVLKELEKRIEVLERNAEKL